jgi:cytochrome c
MIQIHLSRTLMMALAIAGLLFSGASMAQPDADAARLLFDQSDCGKCHNPDKNKKAPSWKKIAKTYKGKATAEAEVIKHMTKGGKVKLDDGSEEEHKVVETKDPKALKNMAQWILSH